MKKIIAVILAAVMLTTVAPLTALAATTGPNTDYYFDSLTPEVTFYADNDYTVFYLNTAYNDELDNAYYDLKTNTLTVKDLKMPDGMLYVVCMGDDFKLNVEGSCELGTIYVDGHTYETSLNITGSGTLYVKGSEYGEDYGIEFADADNGVLNVSDTVTLKIDALESAVAFKNTSREDASGLMNAGGSSYDKFEKTNHVEYEQVYKKVYLENPHIIDEPRLGYIVTCDSDPGGVYTVQYQYDDSGRILIVSKLKFISEYNAYIYDSSFEELYLPADKLESSGFHYVLTPQPEKLEYLPYLENLGYKVYQAYSEKDPGGIYAVEDDYETELPFEDYEGYIVTRVVYDEKNNIYIKDESFTPVKLSAEEFDNSEYKFLYETEEDYDTIEAFEGDPADYSEDETNYYPVVYRESDPDGLYVCAWEEPYSEEKSCYIIKKVFYDNDGDFYYFDDDYDSEPDNVNTFKVSSDEFGEGFDFSFVFDPKETPRFIKYFDKDYDFERWLSEGTKITDPRDKNKVFVYNKYRDYFFDKVSYEVCELEFNEDIGYYVLVDFNIYTEKEFDSIGFTTDNYSDQPVKFADGFVAEQCEYEVYEDVRGKQYLVSFPSDVYDFSEDEYKLIDGEKYYIATLNENIEVDDLEPVCNKKTVENSYDYFSSEKEMYFQGSGVNPDKAELCGDVNCDGKVDGQDSAILARYVSGWNGYNVLVKSMDAADLNRDGKVNGQDAAILSRYVSSWEGYDKYIIAL